MVLPEAVLEEQEPVRSILTPKGLWQSFNGDEYDEWAIKVINVLKLQDLWHFIVEEDPIDPEKFNALTEFDLCTKVVSQFPLSLYKPPSSSPMMTASSIFFALSHMST